MSERVEQSCPNVVKLTAEVAEVVKQNTESLQFVRSQFPITAMPQAQLAAAVSVLAKMNHTALKHHGGLLRANSLTVFKALTVLEKKLVLDVFFSQIAKIGEDGSASPEVEEIKEVVKDMEMKTAMTIDQFNQQQLVSLKTWLVKAGVIGGLTMIVLLTLGAMFFSSDLVHSFTGLNSLVDIFKSIWNPLDGE